MSLDIQLFLHLYTLLYFPFLQSECLGVFLLDTGHHDRLLPQLEVHVVGAGLQVHSCLLRVLTNCVFSCAFSDSDCCQNCTAFSRFIIFWRRQALSRQVVWISSWLLLCAWGSGQMPNASRGLIVPPEDILSHTERTNCLQRCR